MPPQSNRRPPKHRSPRPTGWDAIANWYDGWVGPGGSQFHRQIAIPALLEVLAALPGEQILDLGAGQGVLAPFIAEVGAKYTGVEISPKLLALARQHHDQHGRFLRGDARHLDQISTIGKEYCDAVVFLLSIQDMNPLDAVLKSAAWALKPGGRLVMLLTHPAFRIPRQSGWGFDEERKLQYRRIDSYLSELPVPMKQHPGQSSGVTISFHRPISAYINGLAACGLWLDRMEEVPVGEFSLRPNRSSAEKRADAEIPLFLVLRARK